MGKVFDFRTYFRPLVAAATLLTASVAVADRTVDTEIERADDAYQPNMGVSPIVVPQYVPSAEEQETERKKQERDAFERNETYEQRQLRLRQERERQEDIDRRAAQERKWREQGEASAARTDAERYYRASMRAEDVKAGLAGKQTWSVEDYVRIMDVAEPAWVQMEYYAREGFRVHGNDMALYYAVARHLGAPYGNPSSLEYKKESMDILVRVFDTNDRLAQVRACAIFRLGR